MQRLVHDKQLPCREPLNELIKKIINLLLLGIRSQTSPLLKPGRIPSPIHRKPKPTDFVKKESRPLGLNKNLEEFTFEVFVRSGERAKRMLPDRLMSEC